MSACTRNEQPAHRAIGPRSNCLRPYPIPIWNSLGLPSQRAARAPLCPWPDSLAASPRGPMQRYDGLTNMKRIIRITPILGALLVTGVASAQQPIIYPAKGQSADKQASDSGQCQAWAKQSTGVDPNAIAQQAANQQPAQQPQGGRVRGAAGGAAVGAAVGAIAGDAGKGAAAGAVGGTMVGGARQRRQAAAQSQQQQASQQQTSQAMSTFNRAFSACMTGRGYTVQ